MSATLAGNLTPVGSVANLIVAERAAAQASIFLSGRIAAPGIPLSRHSCDWRLVAKLNRPQAMLTESL
jgi:hypothetical protein